MNFIKNLIVEEDGVTAIEYGLIAALIAAVVVTATTSLGTSLASALGSAADKLTAAA